MTADPFWTGVGVSAVLGSAVVPYLTSKRIRLIGFLSWAFWGLIGLVQIVTFFVEIPAAVVWAAAIGFLSVNLIGFFEFARRRLWKPEKNTI